MILTNILRGSWLRCREFLWSQWWRLGISDDMRRFRLMGYILGSVFGTYAVVNLAYDPQVSVLAAPTRLPFLEFFRFQLLPFIDRPLTWVGLDLSGSYRSLRGFAAVGAAIWANAEFRCNHYLVLYLFPSRQPRPGYLELDLKKAFAQPWPPPTPSLLSCRSLLRLLHIALLTYSLVGALFTLIGLLIGIYVLFRLLKDSCLFLIGLVVWALQETLRPFERVGDDAHAGTRAFLFLYRLLRHIDNALNSWRDPVVIPASEIGTFRPLLRLVLKESGVVCAAIIILVTLLVSTDLIHFLPSTTAIRHGQ